MAGIENFSTYKKGRRGEINVLRELTTLGREVIDYTDYEENKAKQRKGFDIELRNPETQELDRVDIKSNIRNGFTYVEVRKKSGRPGWFYTSQADSIIAYDEDNNHGFIYSLRAMRIHVGTVQYKEITTQYGDVLYAIPTDSNLLTQLF